jgi:hypothetical protein
VDQYDENPYAFTGYLSQRLCCNTKGLRGKSSELRALKKGRRDLSCGAQGIA